MNSSCFTKNSTRRYITIWFVSLIFIFGNGHTLAQDGSYIEANPDHPPFFLPDTESRSTDPDLPPAYGPEEPLVRIVLFSDYQCPSCRRLGPATHQISAEFPEQVRIEVWQRPLEMHTDADLAAAAALAAHRQGKFWEMHDMILESRVRADRAVLDGFAEAIDLDMAAYNQDIDDPEIWERVKSESALAETFDIRPTPGWLINGKPGRGWGSWKSFKSKVQREINASSKLADEGLTYNEVEHQRASENLQDEELFELYKERILREGAGPSN